MTPCLPDTGLGISQLILGISAIVELETPQLYPGKRFSA